MKSNEFTREQVQDLAERHRLNWRSGNQALALMAVVGGHPALVRMALYHLCRQQVTLEQLLRDASTNMGVYRDHLHRLLIILRENPELADALAAVVMAEHKVYIEPELGEDPDPFKVRRAVFTVTNPIPGLTNRLIARWSCYTMCF